MFEIGTREMFSEAAAQLGLLGRARGGGAFVFFSKKGGKKEIVCICTRV